MKASLPAAWSFAVIAAMALTACDGSPYRTAVIETREHHARTSSSTEKGDASVLRFSVASIESPRDTYSAYTRLFDRMGQMLKLAIEFEQRRTYREVNDLLISG